MRGDRVKLAMAGGVVAALGVGATYASFTDQAVANLGSDGNPGVIGNPHVFDIAVTDADGELQDAATREEAVELPVSPGSVLSVHDSIGFTVVFTNREPGVNGDLTIRVFDPDPVEGDLFDAVRFTVSMDGAAPAVANATAAQVAAADLGFDDVAPGESREVRVDMRLAAGQSEEVGGLTTRVGILADGVSR